MKSLLFICLLLLPLSSYAANNQAPNSVDKSIRAGLTGMPVKSIYKTPIQGLYEVQVDNKIFYTDKTGHHLLNGHMFNTATKQDLTATRLAEMSRIDWSQLPLEKAIVSGPKNGLKMAVFTDPDCPYCTQLEAKLENIDGLRVYTFLFPLTSIHPGAYAKAESIWCAKDQHQALVDVMINKATLPKATCSTPLDDLQKLATKLNVQGTPTIFAEDGRKFGGVPLEQLKSWLQQGT